MQHEENGIYCYYYSIYAKKVLDTIMSVRSQPDVT